MLDFSMVVEFSNTLDNLELKLKGRGNKKAVRKFFKNKEDLEGMEAGKMNVILNDYRNTAEKLFENSRKRYPKLYKRFDPIDFINLIPRLTSDFNSRCHELLSKSEMEYTDFLGRFERCADALTDQELERGYFMLEDFKAEQRNYKDSILSIELLLKSVRAYYTLALIVGLEKGNEENLTRIVEGYVAEIGLDIT